MKRILGLILTAALAVAALSACGAGKLPPKDGAIDQSVAASYSTIFDYLRSKVAGVRIGYGNPPSISIRGNEYTSVNTPITDVLILVDGAEVRDISYLAPTDVYSVQVIKPGESASYGFRGAGGVLKITTIAAHNAAHAEDN